VSREPNKEIERRKSEILNFKSPPCDFQKTEISRLRREHRFWSLDRQEFVQAGTLEIGERLQVLSGDVNVVQKKLPRPAPLPDFNLEVHDEHVYFVGEDGVLVHSAGRHYILDPEVQFGRKLDGSPRAKFGPQTDINVPQGRDNIRSRFHSVVLNRR
jgi:hypothetical protein